MSQKSGTFRFPPYRSDGAPSYWKFEQTGRLAAAIKAYLNNRIDKTAISPAECDLVKTYLQHWIYAPGWQENRFDHWPEDLKRLREAADQITDADSIERWIHDAIDLGIDPL